MTLCAAEDVQGYVARRTKHGWHSCWADEFLCVGASLGKCRLFDCKVWALCSVSAGSSIAKCGHFAR